MITNRQVAVLSHLHETNRYDIMYEIVNKALELRSAEKEKQIEDRFVADYLLIGAMGHIQFLKNRHENGECSLSDESSSNACCFKLWIEIGLFGIPESVSEEYLGNKYVDKSYIEYLEAIGLE